MWHPRSEAASVAGSKRSAGVRWQWTHGDYEWRNVLFNEEDEVVAVLDFDNLVYYGRERDVMRCIALTFPAGAPEAAAFFAGYATESGLTADEARNYVDTYRYFSTFRTWPISARYLEPANYQPRWDDLIKAGPEISWQWDDLADRFAAVAANLDGRSD